MTLERYNIITICIASRVCVIKHLYQQNAPHFDIFAFRKLHSDQSEQGAEKQYEKSENNAHRRDSHAFLCRCNLKRTTNVQHTHEICFNNY